MTSRVFAKMAAACRAVRMLHEPGLYMVHMAAVTAALTPRVHALHRKPTANRISTKITMLKKISKFNRSPTYAPLPTNDISKWERNFEVGNKFLNFSEIVNF